MLLKLKGKYANISLANHFSATGNPALVEFRYFTRQNVELYRLHIKVYIPGAQIPSLVLLDHLNLDLPFANTIKKLKHFLFHRPFYNEYLTKFFYLSFRRTLQ